nr:immunoglobulin light chain junction region [Macaca mulatta]MOX08108.1 immunoglobulin light chain junction region [Macaca mulatta]MOX08817.1 immunoglobulin light chain junction region [Macaca mulatta]MOX09211.1 immunoglobulin light chain junction region [Macaca mulatta]MOX09266.1 immunoglobulin light chain junction region [Macaca mulatta]
CMQGQEFPYTF